MSIQYLLDGYNIIHSAAMQNRWESARKFSAAQQKRNDDPAPYGTGEEFSCQMKAPEHADLQGRRWQLISFVEQYSPQGSSSNSVTIVFDGNTEVFGGMSSPSAKVLFSQGESADDKIKAIVSDSNNPKTIIVVSDDRGIKYAVGAMGATAISVRDFLSQANISRSSGKASRKKGSHAGKKYISKRDEAKINEEMGSIWLKGDGNDE